MISEIVDISKIVKILSDDPNLIIDIIFVIMVIFSVLEVFSCFRKNNTFKDYKPIIISVGILGTFIGIFVGLWNFDPKDIADSVPKLLEGLKLAFVTSILGMFFAIVLAFIENQFRKEKDSSIDITEMLKKIYQEQKVGASAHLEMLEKILLAQNQGKEKTDQIIQAIDNSKEDITKHLKEVNISLDKAIEHLSKTATQEIIKALESVVFDFNKNLKEQFGENFKQLNESVKNMIQWQENYKTAIEQIEKTLSNAILQIEKTANYTEQFTIHYEKISTISQDLKNILKESHNQVNAIERDLSSLLQKIRKEAELITASLNDLSTTIQKSLSSQSTALTRLNEELNKQLTNSLGNLNTALATLTNKFREDYESYLSYFKNHLNEFKNFLNELKEQQDE